MKSFVSRIVTGLVAWFTIVLPLQALTISQFGRIVPPATGIDLIRIKPGDRVEFDGTGLDAVVDVRFGLASASIVTRTPTRLVVVVPQEATTGPVSLYDLFLGSIGLAYTSSVDFELAPLVAKFERSEPTAPTPADKIRGVVGNAVLFTGANFIAVNDPGFATTVYFPSVSGGYVVAPVDYASQTTIQARVPLQAVSGNIVLANPSGYVTTTGKFYLQPLVTGFDPAAAHVGDTVTLSGYSLLDTASVSVGGIPATILSGSGTNVQIRVPVLSKSGAVSLTTPGGTFLTASELVLLPAVNSFLPGGGGAGTVVTITGSGLAGTTQVRFGNAIATTVTNVDSTTVTAVVPLGAFTGPLTVTTGNGSAVSTTPFYVAPVVADINPSRAKAGSLVTVTGNNVGDATAVVFGGGAAALFTVQATNRVTAIVPEGAVTGSLKVTTPGGTASSPVPFQVIGTLPVIYGFTPSHAGPGETVTVNGDNLASPTSVSFNGTPATSYVAVGSTSVMATVPAAATSGPITVTTAKGTASSPTSFLVGTVADLSVSVQADTKTPVVGSSARLTFVFRNLGPLPAENASFGIVLPSNADVLEATTTLGTVEQLGLGLNVTAATFEPGAQATVVVRVRVKNASPASFSAVASSDTPDDATANNTALVTLVPQRPTLAVTRGPATLTLAWFGASFVPQRGPAPTGPWQDLAEVPTSEGGAMNVGVAVGPGTEFYRLRLGP